MEANTREFARNFAHYRRMASLGENVRISSRDGVFVFSREGPGMTALDLLARLSRLKSGKGIFSSRGAERIEAGARIKKPARSPWDE
ncbi:MAG: hypothetical protein ABSH26_14025 [Opitutaceae bacterium]|jgi:hypothetical protein